MQQLQHAERHYGVYARPKVAVQCVASAWRLSVPSKRTATAKDTAVKILASVEDGKKALHAFSSEALTLLRGIVDKSASKTAFSARKAEIWRGFHGIRTTKLKDKFLCDTHVKQSDSLLMQYIYEKMFDEVVKSHFSTPSQNPDESELTPDELGMSLTP